MWHSDNPEKYEGEKRQIDRYYPKLKFKIINEIVQLSGELEFFASFNDQEIRDVYSILIICPTDYPNSVPVSFELGNRIPDDYHKNPDKSLCLATPLDVIKKFSNEPSILNYINNLLIPYLYRFSFSQKHGKAPFGDYSHGALGLIEYYLEQLDVSSISTLVQMLLVVLDHKYRGHSICPCGSTKRLRDCHGIKLQELSRFSMSQVKIDFINISRFLEEKLKK